MTDLFSKFDPLIEQRAALLATGVTDPFSLVMEKVLSPTVAICNGRETILLGTYNYMGMTFDEDVIAAGKDALDKFGSGTTGSRVLNGTYQGHKECEDALKEFYAMDHAMVFSTGYQANLGIISTIAGKGDYVILDIDSHASIYDGCKMGDAEIVAFRHNDVEALEKRLKRLPAEAGKLVVLEGVYSMLGDVAPLKEMIRVSKENGAMVLVDEAHSMGFIGEHGRGVAEAQGEIDEVDFIIGTLSKSVGTVGGFCVSNHPKFEILRLPPVRLHRLAAAERRRDRGDEHPQADARIEQARAPVGKFEDAAQGAARSGLPARHPGAAVGDHRGHHARPRKGRDDVGSAAGRRTLRQSRAPAGDPRGHDAATLLAVCRTFERAGDRDPRPLRARGQARGNYRLSRATPPTSGFIFGANRAERRAVRPSPLCPATLVG